MPERPRSPPSARASDSKRLVHGRPCETPELPDTPASGNPDSGSRSRTGSLPERLEERIEHCQKISRRRKRLLVERCEFKDQRTYSFAVVLESAGEVPTEHSSVQESLVRQPRTLAVSGVFRPRLDRDVFWDFETEDEMLWRCVEQLRLIFLGRELVKRQSPQTVGNTSQYSAR